MAYVLDTERDRRDASSTRLDVEGLAGWAAITERSMRVSGRRVRLRLETLIWETLELKSRGEGITLTALCQRADQERGSDVSLASALRNLALDFHRSDDRGQH